MKKHYIGILVLLLLIGCATNASLSELQKAELSYTEASIAYEAAQNVIVAARSQGRNVINDATWKAFNDAQTAVQIEAPVVRQMLVQWRATNVKPTGFDAANTLLQGASNAAVAIQNGAVKP